MKKVPPSSKAPHGSGANAKARSNSVVGDEIIGTSADSSQEYRLEDQVGFLIRRVHQRATSIFNRHFSSESMSTVQFAALIKICDEGRISQNQLGRLINLDPATVMGVVSRLTDRRLVRRMPDPKDKRRMLLSITSQGLKLVEDTMQAGHEVTRETLSPLDPDERSTFLRLLSKLL